MQLRSGKIVMSNKVFDDKENIYPQYDLHMESSTSTWFKEYCIVMINKFKQIILKIKSKDNIMSLHDLLMEQLRIIDELCFTISLYIQEVKIRPILYTGIYDRTTEFEKYIKKQVRKSFWKREDEWSSEDVRYAKCVISSIKYAQENLVKCIN